MATNKTKAGSLAALAGLAYLASQKGKKGEDTGPTAAPTTSTADRDEADMGTMMRANAAQPAAEEPTMGEDERPAATGMSAATKMLEPKAVSRPRPTTAGKTGSGSGGGRGPKFGEREAYEESRAKTSRPATEAEKSKNAANMYIAAAKANNPITEADKNKNAADMYTLGALAKNRDYKKGGAVKKMASGGMTSSASKRGDGIASKGKTRGKMC